MTNDGPCILLVEDEWIVAADLQDALEHAGYQVLGPAASVSQALKLLEDTQPAAAVLDVQLATENSFPVAEALRRRGTPFVLVSGYCALDLPENLRSCTLLSKPCDPQRVLEALGLLSVPT